MLDFSTLKCTISNYTSISGFVDCGNMIQMFSTMSDVLYEAATSALKKREKFVDKTFPVQSAVNHLEVALASYKKIYMRHRYFRVASWLAADYKSIWTHCFLAICYIYLKELKQAKEEVATARAIYELMKNSSGNPSVTHGSGSPPRECAPEDLALPLPLLNLMQLFELSKPYKFRISEKLVDNSLRLARLLKNINLRLFSSGKVKIAVFVRDIKSYSCSISPVRKHIKIVRISSSKKTRYEC